MWLCGPPQKDQYGVKFAGAYPAGFLANLKDCFKWIYPKDTADILHVCSGRIPAWEGDRLDIDPEYHPDYLCDAQDMFMIEDESYQWVMSDTPYNTDAASKYYGKPMLNKSKVFREMSRVCKVGGFVAVLDQDIVTGASRNMKRIALIGVTVNPTKQIRAFNVYKKMEPSKK